MKIHHLVITWLCACANVAQALSLFPTVTSFDVAATTNREVARGIATDGTNFLVVFQGDNLYAGVAATNQLAAQLLTTNGAPSAPRVDLALNGGVPVVAFGKSNYLMVWNEPDGAASHIHGQFLDRSGNKAGAKFVISSNATAVEVGAIKFGLGQFWVTWAQTNVTNNARIVLQRLGQTGEPVGDLLSLGAATSTNQQFPTLSASVTNMLVGWVAQRAETNAWDVIGRLIESNGNASAEMLISQTPANEPYPIGAASDGSDHLVVWSREAGPPRSFVLNEYLEDGSCCVLSNITVPALFGRILAHETEEFQISKSQWGQFSPVAAFHGSSYIVAWSDRRHSFERYGSIHLYHQPFFQFVSRTGTLVESEFRSYSSYSTNTSGDRLSLVVSMDHALLIRGVKSSASDNLQVVALSPHVITMPRLLVEHTTNNLLRVTLKGNSPSAALYTSTNFIHWSRALIPPFYQEQIANGEYREFSIGSHYMFFRAEIGNEQCRSNLRKIDLAKEQFAIKESLDPWAPVAMTDLFSVFPPSCPQGGYYFVGTVIEAATCNIPDHRLP